jgi:hypothetical protein
VVLDYGLDRQQRLAAVISDELERLRQAEADIGRERLAFNATLDAVIAESIDQRLNSLQM